MEKATLKGFQEFKPTEEEFLALIEEFWFEAFYVAKYLKRQDFWSVKFKESYIQHKIFLKMIRWHTLSLSNWTASTHSLGENLHKWTDKDVLSALNKVFSHLDLKGLLQGFNPNNGDF